MMNKFQGNEKAKCLIDVSRINALKGIGFQGGIVRIGAAETLASLAKNDLISSSLPLLTEAILSVGSPLIRLSATLGGNVLCENRCLYYNQSEWWRESVGYCLKCNGDICIATQGKNACFSELVSDTAPALIALNASVEYTDARGLNQVPLEDIYTGDGVNPRNLPKEAVVCSILVPAAEKPVGFFAKLRQRESLEFTSLTCCMAAYSGGRLKIALSGVDPGPVVVSASLDDDNEVIITRAVKGSRAVDNDMYSRKYRREMIRTFIEQGIKKIKLTYEK